MAEILPLAQIQPTLSASDQLLGERLMRRADMWTDLRSKSAMPLGAAVAFTDESFVLSAAIGASMATDALDGRDARKGAEILGIQTTTEGAVSDPKADKDLVNALMLGFVGRFVRKRDFLSAAVVGVNFTATQIRDYRMGIDRKLVAANDLNKDELKAKTINKAKTASQMAAIETLVSPLATNKKARLGALVALSAGTVLGWIGERQYSRRVNSLIALQGTQPRK